jgi:hypothetical protein
MLDGISADRDGQPACRSPCLQDLLTPGFGQGFPLQFKVLMFYALRKLAEQMWQLKCIHVLTEMIIR